jgi:dephospho-CoA kinase
MKQNKPYLLGLTGSIGTGKSTTARMLGRLKIPVHDADAEVHQLLEHDKDVLTIVGMLFPECLEHGKLNRMRLGLRVFHDRLALSQLEEILHPRVRHLCEVFITKHAKLGTPLAVLDIPLLFEAGYAPLCDKIIVTTCEPTLQRERVLSRPGMVLEKFQKIIENQMPAAEKEKRADFLVNTTHGRLDTFRQLRHILDHVCLEVKTHARDRP